MNDTDEAGSAERLNAPGRSKSAFAEGSNVDPGSVTRPLTPNVQQPPSIPDYDLLRRIGGGSYGEVWLARSTATGVFRAVKIVWRHTFDDDRPFQREFEGIQRFEGLSREHPSQLALFHVGRGDGHFFYVMELADAMANPNDETVAQNQGVRISDFGLPSTFGIRICMRLTRSALTSRTVAFPPRAWSNSASHSRKR